MSFDNIFEPIQIGGVTLKNRLVMPAMDSGTTTEEHKFSEQSIAYFSARAKGGFALIIPEYMAISPYGVGNAKEVGLWDESFIPNLKKYTDAVHKNGAKTFAQLHHSGMMCVEKNTGVQPAGPSAIAAINYLEKVREYSNEEVYELISMYGKAARIAQKAGVDGIEMHAAHGYLGAQFLSKFTNKRVDEFGGSYENRFRFVEYCYQEIRKVCGKDYPIILRLSADEFLDAGSSVEDALIYAKMAEDTGYDAIHLSTGTGMGGNIVTPQYFSPGFNVPYSERLKSIVKIPVITVGRINDPYLVKEILDTGRADMVSLGRQSVCDPEFPNKTKEGRTDEIFCCTGCMQRCYYSGGCEEGDTGISCMINPFSGKEYKWQIEPAEMKKKIIIVGAGPAGLEAAWILAKRGHEVDVYEKNSTAGGTFRLAAVPPKKQDLGKTIFTYTTLCKKYGANIHYNTEVNEEFLKNHKQDVIITATGCQPLVPRIPGVDPEKIIKANDILAGKEIVANKKVLIIGGGLVGCETGEFLNIYHNDVSIIDMVPKFAKDCIPRSRVVLMKRLENENTKMYPDTKVIEVMEDGILAERNGEKVLMDGYDAVVMALGARNYNPIEGYAENYAKEVYTIGDAARARDAKMAIYEAAKLGMQI